MSTPDFDAAIERAVNAIAIKMCDYPRTVHEELARAVLEACGWEEAAAIARDLDENCFDPLFVAKNEFGGGHYEPCGHCTPCRARAWVAQYTPTSEGT